MHLKVWLNHLINFFSQQINTDSFFTTNIDVILNLPFLILLINNLFYITYKSSNRIFVYYISVTETHTQTYACASWIKLRYAQDSRYQPNHP